MGKSLLALSDESRSIRDQLESMVDPETGEIPDSAIDLLMENQIAITDKLNGYLDFMTEIKQTVEVCKDKIKGFNAKVKQIKAIEDRMRFNLKKYMVDNDINQIKCDKTISLSKPKDKIIIDEDLLPIEYKVGTLTYSPAMDAIELAIAGGLEVPGVTVIQNQTLSVR